MCLGGFLWPLFVAGPSHGNGLQQEGGDERRDLRDINAKGKQGKDLVQEGKRQRNKPRSVLKDIMQGSS